MIGTANGNLDGPETTTQATIAMGAVIAILDRTHENPESRRNLLCCSMKRDKSYWPGHGAAKDP